jgi:hypothetical protein
MHFASNRLKWKPREMGILMPTNRHYRQTLLATFHADFAALPISFIVDAAECASPPATSASKPSEKIIRFQRTRSSLQTWMYTVRPSPVFHWKMASMPLLDETMPKNGVKVGVGTPNLCIYRAFQETRGNKKDFCLLGICIYCSHTCCYWLADHTNCCWSHYLWALHGSWMVNGFDVLIFTVYTWWGKNFQHKI